MPAVDPRRLRFQIEELMVFFNSPKPFHQHLLDFFSLYAHRTLRFSNSLPPRPLIPVFNIPQPVMRQLNLDLNYQIKKDPNAALELADELWEDSHLEVKLVAINILGSLPIKNPDLILMRISKWMSPDLEYSLLANLFFTGTNKLQNAFPDEWEQFVTSFLNQDKPEMITLGLIGLSESIKNPAFINLPMVFRLISPFIRNPKSADPKELQNLVTCLIERSPIETAFFLRQTLAIGNSPATARLIKNCLNQFPEELRSELKDALNI